MKFHLLLGASLVVAPLESLAPISSTEACRLNRSGSATGPSADICALLGSRWTKLMGTNPNPGSIHLVDREGYLGRVTGDAWILESPRPVRERPSSAHRTSDGLLKYYADNIIPHEAGHYVFGASIGALAFGSAATRYGTQVPDWLDEGVAVWMESAPLREKRIRPVRRSTPSLSVLVTLEHPNADFVAGQTSNFQISTRTVAPPCAPCTWLADTLRKKFQVTDAGTDATGRAKTVVWYADKPPSKSDTFEQREFYPLAYSLLRFIRIRGGTAAVRELVARYQVNPAPRVDVLNALPGLPASVAALEQQWHAFLASLPAEDK